MTDRALSAKQLRASLPKIVARVRRGERFTVLYRSRPAFRIVPVSEDVVADQPLADDPLYGSEAVGASSDGLSSKDHDRVLYGR
jgi:prevent-host-death family protein